MHGQSAPDDLAIRRFLVSGSARFLECCFTNERMKLNASGFTLGLDRELELKIEPGIKSRFGFVR